MSAGRLSRRPAGYRLSRRIWSVALVGIVVSSAWVSHAADEAVKTGLRGVLPANVPAGVTASIEALPDNWKAWGDALSGHLTKLYEEDGVDEMGQRKAIGAIDANLKTLETTAANPAYRAIANQLRSLHSALKRRVDLAKAALDTLAEGAGARTAKIDSARKQVAQAAAALDRYLAGVQGGQAWGKYLQTGAVQGQSVEPATVAAIEDRFGGPVVTADAKTREFLDRPAFTAYKQAVHSYREAVQAPAAEANSPALRKSLGELLGALEDYELAHSSASAGAVRKSFLAATAAAPDGGDRISAAVRQHYLNYNLRVIASESFLNKIASDRRQVNGEVRDQMLGANVYGNQTTYTQVSIDLVPSPSVAQFDIVANGQIVSNTVGVTDQAQIYTQGNHSFTAAKRIVMNGERFSTQPARMLGVSANNTTTGANTNVGGLFSGFANRIAVNKANEMRGQSEAIAASRVQENVIPQLNTEVDKEFGANSKVNSDIAEKLAALRELQLYPDVKSWSSTDSELRVMTRLMTEGELGGGEPDASLILGRGVSALLHESLLNNATDRLDLKGQTLTDEQFQAKIDANITKLLGKPLDLNKDKPAVSSEESSKSLIFAKDDPIRFQAADGALVVTLRAGLKQEGKEEIPTQIITIPLRFSVNDKNIVVEPGSVSVSAVEKADNPAQQGVRAGVIKKKIEAAFPRREIDRVINYEHDKKKLVLAVTRIKILDGWVSVTIE